MVSRSLNRDLLTLTRITSTILRFLLTVIDGNIDIMESLAEPNAVEGATSEQFPPNTQFKFPWRKYQARVLNELDTHLSDNHLHIVAPPGSGKTVLGLEIAIRLNKPTLILAPTIAIRNQWVQRLCELFLQVNSVPEWISSDIKKPAFLTVATYQGLYAACSNTRADSNASGAQNNEITEQDDENTDNSPASSTERKISNTRLKAIIKNLRQQHVATIVVDEAHHLKNAWWKVLTEVKQALSPTVVGLTATPPYDVSHAEWQRYLALNGPVDAEISVPELVLENDLCPHQDYLYLSLPIPDEQERIEAFRRRLDALITAIMHDEQLLSALKQHPAFLQPLQQTDWIYGNIEYYSAILIYLNQAGIPIHSDHLEVLEQEELNLPALDKEWLTTVLTLYLWEDNTYFSAFEQHQQQLLQKLKHHGVLDRKTIQFAHNRKINQQLTSSLSKLASIRKIVQFEHSQLKHELRMVILTDYIRKEFLVNEADNKLALTKLGTVPVFEQLRRDFGKQIKLGILTGSLVIIPVTALSDFKTRAALHGVDSITATPLAYDAEYLSISVSDKLKHDIVHIVTQVFQQGGIEVLIGTKSLLGEGWDAPAINTLILASTIGSYVLSNQMRGRAIRVEQGNTEKTGNIWHLACVDSTSATGGDDFDIMQRRFHGFVGVSVFGEPEIENGIRRLRLPSQIKDANDISSSNADMLTAAGNRTALGQRWQQALRYGHILVEEMKVPYPSGESYQRTKRFYFNKTIGYFIATIVSSIAAFAEQVADLFFDSMDYFETMDDIYNFLFLTGILFIVLFGTQLFKAARLLIKYRDIAWDIHQIGEALLKSLIHVKAIHTSHTELSISSTTNKKGEVFCHLEGGTTYEKSLFIKTLQEVVDLIDNPRYIMVRKHKLLNLLTQKDYHTVPDIIGRKKAWATHFYESWETLVGPAELVYTRTLEGRRFLLKSRVKSLTYALSEKSERISQWR